MDLSHIFKIVLLVCLCVLSYSLPVQTAVTLSVPVAPIVVRGVEVIPSKTGGCTNVTVAFTAMSKVQIVWTIDKGIKPEDVNPSTMIHNHLTKHGDSHTSICLPSGLVYDKLVLHLLCEMHSFELHLDMRIPKATIEVREPLEQYDLIVPKPNEIGVTSRGEARFPVMVNNSATGYAFGLLQAEVTLLYGNYIRYDSAFSFLPASPNQIISAQQVGVNGKENLFNIALKSNILRKGEAFIAIMAASSNPNSIVERLDIKQGILLRRGNDKNSGFNNALHFPEGQSEVITIKKHNNAIMVCETVGDTNPSVTLYKRTLGGIEPVNVPSYTTSLPPETVTTFQLLNVTEADSGVYICKVAKNQRSSSKVFTVNVVTS
ncbi:hypothetical protein ACF0H5_009707 [Mactra antiquata]